MFFLECDFMQTRGIRGFAADKKVLKKTKVFSQHFFSKIQNFYFL